MNFEKYGKESFEKIKSDSEKVRELIEELQNDVTEEIRDVISTKLNEITSKLNSFGHQLKENEPDSPEDFDYCEFHNDEEQTTCGFRLGAFLTISAGYYNIGENSLNEENT